MSVDVSLRSKKRITVHSGFDLHRFLQALSHVGKKKKKNRKRSCQAWDSNLGLAVQKSVMLKAM